MCALTAGLSVTNMGGANLTDLRDFYNSTNAHIYLNEGLQQ